MEFSVYIRPLQIEDAEISYKWRNNSKIWRHTGNRPTGPISHKTEKAWLAQVLERKNEKRFAICLKINNAYIGNIYFTDINKGKALIHIFIGDVENWGRRRAFEAIILLGIYGFSELELHTIEAIIDKNNILSKALAKLFDSTHCIEFTEEHTGREMTKWIFNKKSLNKILDQNNYKI